MATKDPHAPLSKVFNVDVLREANAIYDVNHYLYHLDTSSGLVWRPRRPHGMFRLPMPIQEANPEPVIIQALLSLARDTGFMGQMPLDTTYHLRENSLTFGSSCATVLRSPHTKSVEGSEVTVDCPSLPPNVILTFDGTLEENGTLAYDPQGKLYGLGLAALPCAVVLVPDGFETSKCFPVR